jgi:hypothetical protein
MDQKLNNGMGYSNSLNTDGMLAWGEGYLMLAYVEMYRATGDQSWLDKMVDQFDIVKKNRDDFRKVADYYRKIPLAGWGSDEYSSGKWHVWAIHTAMICQGPIEFVQLVKAEQRLRHKYARQANDMLIFIKECVAVFDPDWHVIPNTQEGYYSDPAIGPLPLNQQNALGIINLGIYLVTRDHLYRTRVERLASYFKDHMRFTPDGAVDWLYCPGQNKHDTDTEDILHAAVNVDFARKCANNHIVFNKKDILALCNTWLKHVHRSDREWADNIDGSGSSNTYMPQAVWGWIGLSQYNKKILTDMESAYVSRMDDRTDGAYMLGLAELARWQHELTKHRKRWF